MIKRRKIFYAFSTILIVASIISLAIFRLPLGIDFKGGSIMELTFESDEGGRIPSGDEIRAVLSGFSNGTVTVQSSGENSFILRFDEITEETHIAMLERLEGLEGASAREERFDSIGPTIGAETTRKSLQAMGLVIVMV